MIIIIISIYLTIRVAVDYQSHIFLKKGKWLLKRKEFNGAAHFINKTLEIRPEWGEALIYMGRVHALTGQYDKALDYFERASRSAKDFLLNLYTGYALEKAGKYEEALEEYDKGLTYSPVYEPLRIAKADLLYNMALQIMSKSEGKNPSGKQLRFGPFEFEEKNVNQALEKITEAGKLKTEFSNYYFLSGALRIIKGNLDAGLSDLIQGLKRNPFDLNGLLWLARSLHYLNLADYSARIYSIVFSLTPDTQEAFLADLSQEISILADNFDSWDKQRNFKLLHWRILNQTGKNSRVSDEISALQPSLLQNDPEILLIKAESSYHQERIEEAAKIIKDLLEVMPDNMRLLEMATTSRIISVLGETKAIKKARESFWNNTPSTFRRSPVFIN